MTDFGSRLKQAREQRGISQRQIAAATKISTVALEALERNDFSRLPGGIFSRAFVRAYALEVGLDPEATVQEFLVEFEQNYTARAERPMPEITADDRAFLEKQQRAGRWLRAASIALIMLVAALIVGWRVVSSRSAAPKDETKAPPARQARQAGPTAPPVVPPAPVVTPPVPAQTPPALPAEAAPAPAPAAPIAADQVAIRLEITGDCWTRVTVDGVLMFEQTLRAGDNRDVKPGRSVYLQVGNAGVVRWFINGMPAKELGKAGQTAAVRIDRAALARYVGP
jgi:cytoskeleton protein RodZ